MPVAIVNEELARKYLSDVDPLTQRISVSQIVPGTAKLGPMVDWQIVGVYQNVRTPDPKDGQRPEIIVPFAQSPWPGVNVAVRTNGDPASMTNSIAAVVRSPRFRPADGGCEDHGSAARRIDGSRSLRRRFVWDLCGDCACSRRLWHLWRHVFRRRTTHARNRIAHGARRRFRASAENDFEGGFGSRSHRYRDWPRGRVGSGARYAKVAVRDRRGRLRRIQRSGRNAHGLRCFGVLYNR